MKPLGQEVADQATHFAVAMIACVVVAPAEIYQAVFLGFILGAIREVTEGGNVLSSGSIRDVVFWTLGGLAYGLIHAFL